MQEENLIDIEIESVEIKDVPINESTISNPIYRKILHSLKAFRGTTKAIKLDKSLIKKNSLTYIKSLVKRNDLGYLRSSVSGDSIYLWLSGTNGNPNAGRKKDVS